jgi:ketosteroid isomerase-like protein
MPSQAAINAFIALVESGKTVEAMESYYAENATMQENSAPPRAGKTALIKFEHAALASIESMKATCVHPVFVSGDFAVIRWIFEIRDKAGKEVRFEELAHQRWEGDLMVEERFFYDPAQLK